MHKKVVLIAIQKTLSYLVKPNKINNVFNVNNVIKLLLGKNHRIASTVGDTGLNYGLKKATALGNCALYPATVIVSLRVSKITGYL